MGRSFLLLWFLCLIPVAARADGLPDPTGDPLLVVSGRIALTNVTEKAVFDRAMLEQLPRSGYATSTPWTQGVVRFDGVLLSDLLAAVGGDGELVKVFALNDYHSEIPRSDWTRYAVLIADRVDGKAMRVRDKGPLWIVYPLDDHPELRTNEIHGRMVWQLRELIVE